MDYLDCFFLSTIDIRKDSNLYQMPSVKCEGINDNFFLLFWCCVHEGSGEALKELKYRGFKLQEQLQKAILQVLKYIYIYRNITYNLIDQLITS